MRVRKSVLAVLIVAMVAVLAVIGVVVFRFVRNRQIAASTLKQTEETIYGNTGGNLYNSGLFCQQDGIIYFANPNDSFKLYSMTNLGEDQQKICDDSVCYINCDENYIYYTRKGEDQVESNDFMGISSMYPYALCRIEKDGSHQTVLDHEACMYACLVGDYIYYLHYDTENATNMYRIKTDGTNRELVSKSSSLPCSAYKNVLYYNGTLYDHNLYSLDSDTNVVTSIYSGNAWQPIYSDGFLYFLNLTDDYTICRIDMTSYEATTIVSDSVQNFNVYGNRIYYVTKDEDVGLYRCDLDGENTESVYSGNCCDINITDGYVYFRLYENDTVFYRTPTDSAINVKAFVPKIVIDD